MVGVGKLSAYKGPDNTNGHSSLELGTSFFLLFGEDCPLPFFFFFFPSERKVLDSSLFTDRQEPFAN